MRSQPLKFSSSTPRALKSQADPVKRRKSNKRSRRKQSKRRPQQSKPQVFLSKCSQGYALTLSNPFDHHGFGLTCTPTIPSLKQNAFVKGTLNTGGNGFGFIMADPFAAACNDRNCCWGSTSATAVNVAQIADPNTFAVGTNSPYVSAQITGQEDGITFRVVSAGLRIRYTGTTLNQGGTVYALSHPSHSDMDGATLVEVRAINVSKNFSVDRDWISVLWCPVTPTDYGFQTSLPPINVPFILMMQVPPGTSLTFEFELNVNFEFVGAPIRGMTPSHSDAVGFTATQSALQGTNMVVPPREQPKQTKSLISRIESNIWSEASHVASSLWKNREAIVEGVGDLISFL